METMIQELVVMALALAKSGGEFAGGTVEWVKRLIAFAKKGSVYDVIDAWLEAIDKAYATKESTYVDLKRNKWATKGLETRALYDAYRLVIQVLDANLVYVMKGFSAYWHIELVHKVLTYKVGKDTIIPNVTELSANLNSVLHNKEARAEIREQTTKWETALDVLRGMDDTRLKKLLLEGEYVKPSSGKGASKTKEISSLQSSLISKLAYFLKANQYESILAMIYAYVKGMDDAEELLNYVVENTPKEWLELLNDDNVYQKTSRTKVEKDDDAD